jgi:hypothetical protein
MIIKMFMTDLFKFHGMHVIMKVSQIKTLKNCYCLITADRFSTAFSLVTILSDLPYARTSSNLS